MKETRSSTWTITDNPGNRANWWMLIRWRCNQLSTLQLLPIALLGRFDPSDSVFHFQGRQRLECVTRARRSVLADGEVGGEEEQNTHRDVEKWGPCSWLCFKKKKEKKKDKRPIGRQNKTRPRIIFPAHKPADSSLWWRADIARARAKVNRETGPK